MHAGMSAVRYGAVARRRHMAGEEVERRSEEEKEVLFFSLSGLLSFHSLVFYEFEFSVFSLFVGCGFIY